MRLRKALGHPVACAGPPRAERNRSGVTRQQFFPDGDDLTLDLLNGQQSLVALQDEPFRMDVVDHSVHLAPDIVSGSDVGEAGALLAFDGHLRRRQQDLAARVPGLVFGQPPGFGKAEMMEELGKRDTGSVRLGEIARPFLVLRQIDGVQYADSLAQVATPSAPARFGV